MNPLTRLLVITAMLTVLGASGGRLLAVAEQRPNILLIVCDDLNSYVEGFGGHPQAKTPNIARLIASGMSFQQGKARRWKEAEDKLTKLTTPSRESYEPAIKP